jgi:hypothetical protein
VHDVGTDGGRENGRKGDRADNGIGDLGIVDRNKRAAHLRSINVIFLDSIVFRKEYYATYWFEELMSRLN